MYIVKTKRVRLSLDKFSVMLWLQDKGYADYAGNFVSVHAPAECRSEDLNFIGECNHRAWVTFGDTNTFAFSETACFHHTPLRLCIKSLFRSFFVKD